MLTGERQGPWSWWPFGWQPGPAKAWMVLFPGTEVSSSVWASYTHYSAGSFTHRVQAADESEAALCLLSSSPKPQDARVGMVPAAICSGTYSPLSFMQIPELVQNWLQGPEVVPASPCPVLRRGGCCVQRVLLWPPMLGWAGQRRALAFALYPLETEPVRAALW